MTREDYINEFIDCMRELLDLGFDVEKNSACDIIAGTFELMRFSGCVDGSMINDMLFDIIFQGKTEEEIKLEYSNPPLQ